MRDFVTRLPNLRIALNLHAWGPLFIYPFNYLADESNSVLVEDYPSAFKFYDSLSQTVGLGPKWKVGNAMQTIEYQANGEASDWMLAELGIYALSVELGGGKRASQSFFIEDSDDLLELLIENDSWIY